MPSRTKLSLPNLIDRIPLVADLHVHLLGTGDTDFWSAELRALPATSRLPSDLPLPKPNVPTNPHRLADQKRLLDQLLVIDRELWPLDHGDFSKYLKLRQEIAWEQPESLARLIVWNAERYVGDGIYYVEFSVGAGWLRRPSHAREIVQGIKDARRLHDVEVRVLLAFNREQASRYIHNASFLRSRINTLDLKLAPLSMPEYFESHLEQLRDVIDVDGQTGALGVIVGLDYMGDELNAPYPPFLLDEFQSFARDMRSDHPRFGFRLHCGERSFPQDPTGYVALRVAHEVIDSLTRRNFPVRAGHAVGLAMLADTVWKRWTSLYGKTEARRVWERTVADLNAITMELCLSSNHCLVGMSADEHVCSKFVDSPFKYAVLATDDPDVFGTHCSLRTEFRLAHKAGLISEESHLFGLVEESTYGSFADDATIGRVAAQVQGLMGVVRVAGRPVEADPPPAVLKEIERLIAFDKPHKAIDRIWRVESAYRRSQRLQDLTERANADLRDLNTREGSTRSYEDWTPPNLRPRE